MNSSREMTVPRISRRARELGTENAFVVLAEVNALMRQGKDIISFLHRPARFPTPVNIQDAGDQGDTRRQARLHAVGRHRRAARGRRARPERARGIDVPPDDVVVGAGAKPFIAYTIALGHRPRRRRRSHLSRSRVSRSTNRRSKPTARCRCRSTCAKRATSASIRTSSRRRSRRRRKLLILNSPQNPTGGIIAAADMEAIAEILRKHPQVWVFADEIYAQPGL